MMNRAERRAQGKNQRAEQGIADIIINAMQKDSFMTFVFFMRPLEREFVAISKEHNADDFCNMRFELSDEFKGSAEAAFEVLVNTKEPTKMEEYKEFFSLACEKARGIALITRDSPEAKTIFIFQLLLNQVCGEEGECLEWLKRIDIDRIKKDFDIDMARNFSKELYGMTISEGITFLENNLSCPWCIGEGNGSWESYVGEPEKIKIEAGIIVDGIADLSVLGIESIFVEMFIKVDKDEMNQYFDEYGIEEDERDTNTLMEMLSESPDEVEKYFLKNVEMCWDIVLTSGGYFRNGELYK